MTLIAPKAQNGNGGHPAFVVGTGEVVSMCLQKIRFEPTLSTQSVMIDEIQARGRVVRLPGAASVTSLCQNVLATRPAQTNNTTGGPLHRITYVQLNLGFYTRMQLFFRYLFRVLIW